jgi:hypothetical protein
LDELGNKTSKLTAKILYWQFENGATLGAEGNAIMCGLNLQNKQLSQIQRQWSFEKIKQDDEERIRPKPEQDARADQMHL